jgi:RNA polymerase sigma-70 factor (ECF subfamily)
MERPENILDSWLVLDYRSGNKKALALLVKRWHSKFCKQAYWYTKDIHQAKDIAQESWTIIMKNISKLEDTDKFGSWAMTIVNRKAVDWLRIQKRKSEGLKGYSETKQNHSDTNDNSENEVKDLKRAILELPDDQQMVIRLFYTESCSLKEIGEILNISKGTVKSRLFYAREKLKSIIKKERHE